MNFEHTTNVGASEGSGYIVAMRFIKSSTRVSRDKSSGSGSAWGFESEYVLPSVYNTTHSVEKKIVRVEGRIISIYLLTMRSGIKGHESKFAFSVFCDLLR